jgi:transposase
MAWRGGQAYSQDLRDRVLAAEGSVRAVAAQFQVSPSFVVKVRQRRDRQGETTAGPQRSHTPRKLVSCHAAICARWAERPDTTLEEYRAWLLAEHGIYASKGLIWITMRRLGLTLKKSRSAPPNRTGRMSLRHAAPGISSSPA